MKIRNAQGILLKNLWKLHGGAVSVAHKMNINIQLPVNWCNRGKVPVDRIASVVRVLKLNNIQKFGLNYKALSELIPGAPTWKTVVDSFPFSTKTKDKILFYAPPHKLTKRSSSLKPK